MLPLAKSIAPLGRMLSNALIYLLRDEFTTDAAAPLTSPRTCEPGPGALTIVDTGNKLSIVNGKLQRSTAAVVSFSDPSVYSSGFARAIGLCSSGILRSNSTFSEIFGWRISPSGGSANMAGFFLSGATIQFNWQGVPTALAIASTGNTDYSLKVILRTSGHFAVLDNNLIWVSTSGNQATMYATHAVGSSALTVSCDKFRVFQLDAPWKTDFGIATNWVVSAAINETITAEVNGIAEISWTAVTGQTLNFMVRRTDNNNCWIIRCNQTTGTIKIIEMNAGVETERASAAQTFTNGSVYRIGCILNGNLLQAFVTNVISTSYASASFNNTATGVRTDRAGANFATWPRALSGAALDEIARWTA
ncbi:MAG: hypothetical protein HY863_15740 [Chloroflexi bacterium]|nr:hypothetical protein [Chloroflexota bacterium]